MRLLDTGKLSLAQSRENRDRAEGQRYKWARVSAFSSPSSIKSARSHVHTLFTASRSLGDQEK